LELHADGWLLADERRLEVVLDVLLENAVIHTDDGDTILVSARAAGTKLVVTVSDTGRGIADAELPLLLRRPGKLVPRDSRHAHGTGLGLPSAVEIIECHGGSLSVSSEIGRGSTFSIELPGYAAQSRTAATPGFGEAEAS
jgi:two-component system sensor histidine kinase BaeS